MARQKGVIAIEGKIDGLSFYKTKFGNIVRKTGGFNGERILKEAAYARTRENSMEFGNASKASSLLRRALKNMHYYMSDNLVSSRATQVMRKVIDFDATSERGKRSVSHGILHSDAKAILKGFNFNAQAVLNNVLIKPFTVNTETGVVTINELVPLTGIAFSDGATHVLFIGAWSKLNFDTGMYETLLTNVVDLPIDNTPSTITLTPTGPAPSITGTSVFALQIAFTQLVNGVHYSLNNGAYNCLCVIGVA